MDLDFNSLPGAQEVSNPSPPPCQSDPLGPGCPPPNDSLYPYFPTAGNSSFSPFTFLGLNWNPLGHPPLGVYNSPHFDMHFYMVPNTTVMNITLGEPGRMCTEGTSPDTFYTANLPVPTACFPAGYANALALAPMMGNHYINLSEPQVEALMAGKPNVSLWVEPSFIVGGWSGEVIFLEPMVRQTYIQTALQKPSRTCWEPSLPKEFLNASNYPKQFCIDTTKNGTVRVEMDMFGTQAKPGCAGSDYAYLSYFTALPPPPNSAPLPSYCMAPFPANFTAPGPAMGPGPGPAPAPGAMPKMPPPSVLPVNKSPPTTTPPSPKMAPSPAPPSSAVSASSLMAVAASLLFASVYYGS